VLRRGYGAMIFGIALVPLLIAGLIGGVARGVALSKLRHYDEMLASFAEAIDMINSQRIGAWVGRGDAIVLIERKRQKRY